MMGTGVAFGVSDTGSGRDTEQHPCRCFSTMMTFSQISFPISLIRFLSCLLCLFPFQHSNKEVRYTYTQDRVVDRYELAVDRSRLLSDCMSGSASLPHRHCLRLHCRQPCECEYAIVAPLSLRCPPDCRTSVRNIHQRRQTQWLVQWRHHNRTCWWRSPLPRRFRYSHRRSLLHQDPKCPLSKHRDLVQS